MAGAAEVYAALQADLYASAGTEWHRLTMARVLDELWPQLDWPPLDADFRVLDIDCGAGVSTVMELLPGLPSGTRDTAAHSSEDEAVTVTVFTKPRVSFYRLHIDRPHFWKAEFWTRGMYSKVFFFCLHFVLDQRMTVYNIGQMLVPGGETVFSLVGHCALSDVYEDFSRRPQWAHYLRDYRNYVPPYDDLEDAEQQLRTLLAHNGFTVKSCRVDNDVAYSSTNRQDVLDPLKAVVPFTARMPTADREPFLQELIAACYTKGTLSVEHGAGPGGADLHRLNFSMVVAHAIKTTMAESLAGERPTDMAGASLYASPIGGQRQFVAQLLDQLWPHLDWSRVNHNPRVLNINCGLGGAILELLPRLPSGTRTIATNPSAAMVGRAATSIFAEPRVTFHQLDIATPHLGQSEVWSSRPYSKVFTCLFLNWVQDHRIALTNIAELMVSGGELVLLLDVCSPLLELSQEVSRRPRWAPYMQDYDYKKLVTPLHLQEDLEHQLGTLLAETGFTLKSCYADSSTFFTAKRQESVLGCLEERVPIAARIPVAERRSFLMELAAACYTNGPITVQRRAGPNGADLLRWTFSMMVAHAVKTASADSL